MSYNKKMALVDNINALEIAFRLDNEKRKATIDEIKLLKKFSGFGGLKCVLYEARDESDRQRMPNSEKEMFDLVQRLNLLIRQNSATQQDYKNYMSSLRNSVLTAFYTPSFIPDAITSVIKRAGITINTTLDPSAGIGVFGQSIQKLWPEMTLDCYEKDDLTAKILSATNPDYKVKATGFEKIPATKIGIYDLVTSNIPFGSLKIFDTSFLKSHDSAKIHSLQQVHEYFFLKGIESLRSGGILAFVTSKGIMDGRINQVVRESMMKQCHLLTAVRFPDNLFQESSGINIPSDLVILQKRLPKVKYELSYKEQKFIESTPDSENLYMNAFFREYRQNILAESINIGTNQYGKPDYVYKSVSGLDTMEKQLIGILSDDLSLPSILDDYNGGIEKKQKAPIIKNNSQSQPPPSGTLSLFDLWDEQEIQQQNQVDEFAPYTMEQPSLDWHQAGMLYLDKGKLGIITKIGEEPVFTPIEVTPSHIKILTDYIDLRDIYAKLYYSEKETQTEQPELRLTFNRVYDNFREKHGAINEKKNQKIIMKDAFQMAVQGIEIFKDGEYIKGTLFNLPVAFETNQEILENLSPTDALLESYNKFGEVELKYMSRISGMPEPEIIESLKNRISYNPNTSSWEPYEKFTSCNVYKAIEDCEKWLEFVNEEENETKNRWINRSIEQLREITPKPKIFSEIDLNLGERWIPLSYYSQYAEAVFFTEVKVVYFPAIDKFELKCEGERTSQIYDQWAIHGSNKRYDGINLLSFALQDSYPDVNRRVFNRETQKYETVIDAEKTQLMATKVTALREGFVEWMQKLGLNEKQELMDVYNRKFNCYARPKFDGSHLTFPGAHIEKLNIKELYQSQKDAVWMNLMNKGAIIDHSVGGGKTAIICLTAHEMIRMNISKKIMVLGLAANISAIYNAHRLLYPDDNILFVSDLTPQKRVQMFHTIKNNDWDVIFMSHDTFGKIPQSLQVQREILDAEIEELIATKTMGEELMSKRDKARLEKMIENKKVQYKIMLEEINSHKDKGTAIPDFEEMNIGHLEIDESHVFKNLGYGATKHSRVSGLGDAEGSQRAKNLLLAMRTIHNRTGKNLGASFYSGTTILNSLIEIYSLFYYLIPSVLKEQNITCMDAFLAIYAQKTSEFEINITNDIVNKERFRYFVKTDALAQMYAQITDFRAGSDIKMDRPEIEEELVTCKQTPEQAEFVEVLKRFAQSGNFDEVRPYVKSTNVKAKMLLATDLERKLALDMRMLDPVKFHDSPDNKISRCAFDVAADYYKYNEHKGTQIIFTDYGAYKGNGSFTPVEALKEKLVEEYGIPAHEIRFIQEFNTTSKKDKFMKQMNDGIIRVIIGGTSNLGTGNNIQERCVAINHLDCPWRPGDLQQRNARGARPGNWVVQKFCNNKLKVRHYCTEKSLDSYKFNLLKFKQSFIYQFKSCNMDTNRLDEGELDENTGMNYSAYCAELSGNTDLIEKIKLDKSISKYEGERKAFYNDLDYSKYNYEMYNQDLQTDKITLGRILSDMEALTPEICERLDVLRDFNSMDNDLKQKTIIRLIDYPGITSSEKIGEHIKLKEKELLKLGNKAVDLDIATLGKFKVRLTVENHLSSDKTIAISVHGPGNIFYKHNYGNMPSDKILATLSPERALLTIFKIKSQYEERIQIAEKKLADLAISIQRTWGKEDLLADLKAKRVILERKINRSAYGGGDRGEATPVNLDSMAEEERIAYQQKAQAKSDMVMLGLSDDIINDVLEGEDVILHDYTIQNPFEEDKEVRCSGLKINYLESAGLKLDGKPMKEYFGIETERKNSFAIHR